MKRRLRHFFILSFFNFFIFTSCIEPPLQLPDMGDSELSLGDVRLDLDVLWDYELDYDWRAEWHYGWDETDQQIFGAWELAEPTTFNVRRYFTLADSLGAHTRPSEHQITGHRLRAKYYVGYYDILAWNEVTTIDGVQSLHFDEETTYDYVTAYTNPSTRQPKAAAGAPARSKAHYQPEFLFSGYYEDLYVSRDPKNYDYFDEVEQCWVKNVNLQLLPRTYIYLVQIVLHNNRGRISGVDGSAYLSGMSRSTNLNTGITAGDEILVSYDVRLKGQCLWDQQEQVDIVGGRLFTFGLCSLNPYDSSRARVEETTSNRNLIDLDMYFNVGGDSTFVFDVTDQVRQKYKGGILTVELDVDTVEIRTPGGGSGFDAIVLEPDSVTYEFDM